MYRIKISYLTGDSFGTQDTYDYLELTWKNLDIAKENLQRIKEHYELYEAVKVIEPINLNFATLNIYKKQITLILKLNLIKLLF